MSPTPETTFPSRREEVLRSGFFNQDWYYSIELLPGLFTNGSKHRNFGLTRHLLRRCEVEGRRCLDFGTMEGAAPVLLSRRGAGHVVGVDFTPCDDRVAAVQHYTGARFDYHSGLLHANTVPFLKSTGRVNFDVVVLSGVLYHCFGPLHTLAYARSLLRTGGLLILETFSVVNAECAMYFNKQGVFTKDPSSYFLPSVPLLDYVLRYFKLAPLDCVHGGYAALGRGTNGYKTARVAVACRATNEIVAQDDPWMQEATRIVDYVTLIDWDLIDKSGGSPPAFEGASRFLDPRTETCDLLQTVQKTRPLDLPESVAVLALGDRY